jgi:hypothetical protein
MFYAVRAFKNVKHSIRNYYHYLIELQMVELAFSDTARSIVQKIDLIR